MSVMRAPQVMPLAKKQLQNQRSQYGQGKYAMQQSYKLEAVHMVDMLRSKREFLREHHLIPLRCNGWSCWKPCGKCEKPGRTPKHRIQPMIRPRNQFAAAFRNDFCLFPSVAINELEPGCLIIFRKRISTFLNLTPVARADLLEVPAWLPWISPVHSYCWRKATLLPS